MQSLGENSPAPQEATRKLPGLREKNDERSLIIRSIGLSSTGFRFKCERPVWFGNAKARKLTKNLLPDW